MNQKIIRSIEVYDKNSGELVTEYFLNNAKLEFLQNLFGEPSDEPMYACYRLNMFHVKQLQPRISEKIDIEKYNCYLACVATPN